MNREDRVKLLAGSIAEAARAEKERQDQAKQVDRITAAVREKLTHVHASDDDLVCPNCGYKGSESDFEPDSNDEESDGFSTDPETSETGDSDDVNELDAKSKSRVVAELLKHKRHR